MTQSHREKMEELDSKGFSESITPSTFRPNIVLEGASAYDEDYWINIKIGMEEFQILGKCNRCRMICIDQKTGEEGREPLKTLSSYRKKDGKIYFGVHADHKPQTNVLHSTVKIGDLVSIS
jgi:uncharacterized protein YcbX